MKTIVFKIEHDSDLVKQDERIYSSIVRYSLERFKEGKSNKEIYNDLKSKFVIHSHLLNCVMREGYGIYKRVQDNKFHFGQLKKYVKKLISKEEYLESRNRGFNSEGNISQKGNILFKIDLENNSIVYKRKCKQHISLKIKENLKGKRKALLERIYLSMISNQSSVCFKVKGNNLYITYDEQVIESYKKFKNLKDNRILGIDLNPNYIGLSILEFNGQDNFEVIHKRVYDLSNLNECSNTNKVHYELQQINNQILKLCKHYKVSKLIVEELNFKKSRKFYSKKLNRLCKNKFRYVTISNHLKTLCSTFGVEFIEVNACYSSFIGNIVNGSISTPDMVAASIEIARRGYKKFNKGWFYPEMISSQRFKEVLGNQWKEELKLNFKSWTELFNQIKESKISYRFQLDENQAVFRKIYKKSLKYILVF